MLGFTLSVFVPRAVGPPVLAGPTQSLDFTNPANSSYVVLVGF